MAIVQSDSFNLERIKTLNVRTGVALLLNSQMDQPGNSLPIQLVLPTGSTKLVAFF